MCQFINKYSRDKIKKIMDQKNFEGDTILLLTVKLSNIKILKLINQFNYININTCDDDGIYPIHYAIKTKNIEIINILLNNQDLDINVVDSNDQTVLMYILHYYISDHELFIKVLNNPLINLNITDINNINILSYILLKKYNTNNLDLDLKYLIKLILNKPININNCDINGKYPMTYIIENKDRELFMKINKMKNFDPNILDDSGNTYLMKIVYNINSSNSDIYIYFFSQLLKNPKININLTNFNGNSILMIVCENNRIDLLRYLITSKNLDLNIKNHKKETALSIAKRVNNRKMINILISYNEEIIQDNLLNEILEDYDNSIKIKSLHKEEIIDDYHETITYNKELYLD